ncbi:MAG: hypothetical protein AAF696_09570 [Bacteroidota bacterium]
MQKYQVTDDEQLLGFYCTGNDEVVFFWMMNRYNRDVYLVIRDKIKAEEAIKDVISDVMLKLIETNQGQRPLTLKLINEKVQFSLTSLSRWRAIDSWRKHKKVEAWDQLKIQELLDKEREEDFLRKFEGKNMMIHLSGLIEKKYGTFARQEWEAYREFPKDVKAFAEKLDIKEAHVRSVKQRLRRWVKKIFLDQNPMNHG